MTKAPLRPIGPIRHRDRINGEPRQRVGVVKSFGEATYWHNHPDLLRLAQNMREQLEQQRMTVHELPR